jgi:hypothetical protein
VLPLLRVVTAVLSRRIDSVELCTGIVYFWRGDREISPLFLFEKGEISSLFFWIEKTYHLNAPHRDRGPDASRLDVTRTRGIAHRRSFRSPDLFSLGSAGASFLRRHVRPGGSLLPSQGRLRFDSCPVRRAPSPIGHRNLSLLFY